MKELSLYLAKFNLVAPGIDQSDTLAETLKKMSEPVGLDNWKPMPTSISPRGRKRLSPQTLLAIAAAEQVSEALEKNAAWVFGSAFGEGETLKEILDALCKPEMAIRPLKFQNSVHNAASGQWTIAAKSRSAATSICAGNATAGAGLLKAAMQVQIEKRPIGLVLFDAPLPYPLSASHRVSVPAAAGLALVGQKTADILARLDLTVGDSGIAKGTSRCAPSESEVGNIVLSVLPVLERAIGIGAGVVSLPLNGRAELEIRVTRC